MNLPLQQPRPSTKTATAQQFNHSAGNSRETGITEVYKEIENISVSSLPSSVPIDKDSPAETENIVKSIADFVLFLTQICYTTQFQFIT